MPYIPEGQREVLRRWALGQSSQGIPAATAGELNFLLTELILDYLDTNELSYQTLNDIMGALGEAAAEFRRRVIVPYEDSKIAANGDVYPREVLACPSCPGQHQQEGEEKIVPQKPSYRHCYGCNKPLSENYLLTSCAPCRLAEEQD
jgi:hypothetical protein